MGNKRTRILTLILIFLLWVDYSSNADEVSHLLQSIYANSKELLERTVETRATLKMEQLKNISSKYTSTALWWVFVLNEKKKDQIIKLSSLPDPDNFSCLVSSISVSYTEDREIIRPMSSEGFYALENFQDVSNNLGINSAISFDTKEWVSFYDHKFRKGGLIITGEGIKFHEGTEVLIGDKIFIYREDSWTSKKR